MQALLPSVPGGPAEPVDTSGMGCAKRISVRGKFTGALMIEATGCADADRAAYATVLSFAAPGEKRLYMPTGALRVNMRGLGAPTVTVEADEGVIEGADVEVPAGDGIAGETDLVQQVTGLLLCVAGRFMGTLAVEVAIEPGQFRPVATFTKPGALITDAGARYVRVRRRNSAGMGVPTVSVCGVIAPPPPPEIEEAEDLFVA